MTTISNLYTIASLFKHSLDGMFNQWERAKPLRTGAPHASAILAPEAEWCVRRHVLSMLYPERAVRPETKPWDAHQNAVFLNGWHIHEKWQKLLEQFGHVVEVETSHYDEERMVHFTPDVVIEHARVSAVVEIKGYKHDTFEKLDEQGEPPQAAWHQDNLYCHLLQIPRGLIIVEDKDTQYYKVWCIQHDASLAKPYTDRMYQVKGAFIKASAQVLRGKEPPLPMRKCSSCRDRLAEKCPMRALCFEMEG